MTGITSFAAIETALSDLPSFDQETANLAQQHDLQLTKPPGALGRLEDLAIWFSGWQGQHPPKADNPQILIFAANHGVAQHRVSAFPSDVTAQMLLNFAGGGAAINQLAKLASASLRVIDVGVNDPTRDFSCEPAMSENDFAAAFAEGFAAVDRETDVLVVGEMGIGNTTSAAALCHAFLGGSAADWVGPGTGVDGERLKTKTEIVERSVQRHGQPGPLPLFAALGGKEIAAMAGAIVRARKLRVPVILDGFIATASILPLHELNTEIGAHCWPGHVSAEPAHRHLQTRLNLRKPLLDLGLRLGEGSGAALALTIVHAALACHQDMATFTSAGVSGKEEGAH